MSIAAYIKDIGRGAAGARALSHEAARDVMGRVLDGSVSDVEVGAFLIAMRMKGETLDEITGFLAAVQERCLLIASTRPVVLIPSYNGARKLPNLTALLALWLAREGAHVLVHGPLHDPARVTTAHIFHDLGLAPAASSADIHNAWSRREPAFSPTALLCAPLQKLLDLRRVLGVRGPGHTVAKMLNPVRDADSVRLVNYTHPEFGALMAAWAQREKTTALLLRGTEGEPVADPRRQPRIDGWMGGALRSELSAAAQEGVLAELPLLPREADAATTALYVQSVLSGEKPAPAPLARQVALVLRALAGLSAGQASSERTA
jgi:anthranilate phosphoribosyltransferase